MSILPAPIGRGKVGIVAHAVTDPRRREIFTPDPSDVRRFPVFVYYPAAKGACAPGAYFPPKLLEVYTAEFNLRAGIDPVLTRAWGEGGSVPHRAVRRRRCRT